MLETGVQSLDQEDLLEKEMANHSSILAWKIPCTEEPGRLRSMGLQRAGDLATEHAGFSLIAASGGYFLVEVCGLLIEVVSLVAEHGLWHVGFNN